MASLAETRNPYTYPHPWAQEISDRWWNFGQASTREVLNSIGIAYIAKFLRLGEDIAHAFDQGESMAYEAVRKSHISIPTNPRAEAEFWDAVATIAPGLHNSQQLERLKETGGPSSIMSLMFHLQAANTDANLLRVLYVNALDSK